MLHDGNSAAKQSEGHLKANYPRPPMTLARRHG